MNKLCMVFFMLIIAQLLIAILLYVIIKEKPSRKGVWKRIHSESGFVFFKCSRCGFRGLGAGSKYCPHCGSKNKERDREK